MNKALLRKTLNFIDQFPDLHDQDVWRCETKACFAGWAVTLAGGKWYSRTDAAFEDYLVATRGDTQVIEADDGTSTRIVHILNRAQRVLDLDEDQAGLLFDADADVHAIVGKLLAGEL